jgi:hypothetical protein
MENIYTAFRVQSRMDKEIVGFNHAEEVKTTKVSDAFLIVAQIIIFLNNNK